MRNHLKIVTVLERENNSFMLFMCYILECEKKRNRALEKYGGDQRLQVGQSKGALDLCLDNSFEDWIWG